MKDHPDLFKLSRSDDPVMSKEAAATVVDKITKVQAAVMHFAKQHRENGFVDAELVMALSRFHSPSSLRTRRSELVTKGMLQHKVGRDGKPMYRKMGQRRHIVWSVV